VSWLPARGNRANEEDQWSIEKCGLLHFGGMRPMARMSRYPSMCWAVRTHSSIRSMGGIL